MPPLPKARSPAALNIYKSSYGKLLRRHKFSTKPDNVRPETSLKARARIDRITARLPKSLRSYTAPLVDAPLSHISAFLLLHELTAVVPLLALAGTFHYTQWIPSFMDGGKWVVDGLHRFDRYFRKKGWLDAVESDSQDGGRRGARIVVEFATAYAVTKALLPLRLVLSVWASPWLARTAIVPGFSLFRRLYLRFKKA